MYCKMTELLSPAEKGGFKIEHFEIKELNFRAVLDGIPTGKYVKLTHNGDVVMSDTPMEKRTNASFVTNAHGDVLIGGLGIGMIITAIQYHEKVNSITVIEKHQEVIDLVTSQISFNDKVRIINADVFDWKPERGQRFDCVYMDIWNYINEDVYHEEMKPLKRKYGHYMKPLAESPKRFNACWAEWNARNGRRL